MFQVKVFWIVMPCSVVVGYQRFGGPSWRWRQHGPLKRWYPTTTPHCVRTQKTSSRDSLKTHIRKTYVCVGLTTVDAMQLV